ncbi:hypothetical protein ES708_34320 [subsurface metagenome]
MVGKTNGERLMKEYSEGYGEGSEYHQALLRTFISAGKLKEKYGKDFNRIPAAAIGLYNFYDRLTAGLQQLMGQESQYNPCSLIEKPYLMMVV